MKIESVPNYTRHYLGIADNIGNFNFKSLNKYIIKDCKHIQSAMRSSSSRNYKLEINY